MKFLWTALVLFLLLTLLQLSSTGCAATDPVWEEPSAGICRACFWNDSPEDFYAVYYWGSMDTGEQLSAGGALADPLPPGSAICTLVGAGVYQGFYVGETQDWEFGLFACPSGEFVQLSIGGD